MLSDSRDAGGFYCEHVLFASLSAAAPGTRVGFLHIPDDAATYGGASRDLEAVARVTHAVLQPWLRPDVRLLITGFGPWEDIVDNPSGAFVDSRGHELSHHVGMLHAAVLPVDDRAIDGGPVSIQALHRDLCPDVVLSLGVIANRDLDEKQFRLEGCATDRNLAWNGAGFARSSGQPLRRLRYTTITRVPPSSI